MWNDQHLLPEIASSPFFPNSLNGTVRYACPMIQKGIVVERPPTTHQVHWSKWLRQTIHKGNKLEIDNANSAYMTKLLPKNLWRCTRRVHCTQMPPSDRFNRRTYVRTKESSSSWPFMASMVICFSSRKRGPQKPVVALDEQNRK